MGSYQKLKQIKNITLLFIISMVIAFATIILYFATQDKKENIDKQIELRKTQLDLVFTKKVFELQNKYNSKLEEFITNKKILDAFASRNREALNNLVQIEFNKFIKDEPNFELICFGLPDMTAYYRAHATKKYGDDISKVQGIVQANTLKKRVSGFSIAKLGLFYRVTFPVFKDGKHIGVIAFGINLGYVNDFIQNKFHTESAIIVNTKELRKSRWFNILEEGSIGNYTIISTNGELINQFGALGHNIDAKDIRLENENQIYSIVNDIKIYGIKNKPIAKVILFQDITKEVKIYETYLYIFIIVLIILIFILSSALIMTFNKFLSTIVTINDDLKDLNSHLEERIDEEVLKNRKKEQELFEQSKMASMGDMIGNIAHQWRQPLSAISMTASSIQLDAQLGMIDNDELSKKMYAIVNKAEYLSETINTFRDFIKEKKELKEVVLQERINSALHIVGMVLKDNQITLKTNIDTLNPIKITLAVGELSQVLINIINNAKDILVAKHITTPTIKLHLTQKENYVIISIEDNAGGIPLEILPKIFEPYFTTKHQSQGTGLGLHMSRKIIVESLHGKLYVKNTKEGAKFFIELPLT